MWNDDTKDELLHLLDAHTALDVAPPLTVVSALIDRGIIVDPDVDQETGETFE